MRQTWLTRRSADMHHKPARSDLLPFHASFVKALLSGTKINKERISDCIIKGFAHIREVVKQRYIGPVRKDKKSDWEFDEKIRINLPIKC
ncbi:MAG: hypothetical protein E3K36_10050 [Candidatus Brocadia sp.]|nr:hypothetical protein [Candidatus Brocadia sp.]